MFDQQLLLYTGFAALLTITPGVDTVLVIRSVVGRGQRAGLITTVGICCGLFFHALLSAAGVSVVLLKSSVAFEVMKFIGACYLVGLGLQSIYKLWRSGGERLKLGTKPAKDKAKSSDMKIFMEGLLNNVLNPKAAIFYLALLPQFIKPTDPVVAKSMLLASIHFVLGVTWLSLLTLFLGRMKGLVASSRMGRWLEATSGALLIALGVRLALEQR